MEDENWDQGREEEEEGEEWHQEEEGEGNEEAAEDVEGVNFNKDDFREDVVYGRNSIKEEIVVDQQQIEWGEPPSELKNEGGQPHQSATHGGPRQFHGVTNEFIFGKTDKLTAGQVFVTNVGFGQTLRRMPRELWGAAKPEGRGSLRSPISKIRFTQTGSKQCTTTEECMQVCRELQKYYMDLGFPDIPYNFMIGGDGVLYNGRGWIKQADRSPSFQKLRKSCLDVAYIGDFVDKRIPYEMLSTAADFLKYGLKIARITPFFQAFTFLSDAKRS